MYATCTTTARLCVTLAWHNAKVPFYWVWLGGAVKTQSVKYTLLLYVMLTGIFRVKIWGSCLHRWPQECPGFLDKQAIPIPILQSLKMNSCPAKTKLPQNQQQRQNQLCLVFFAQQAQIPATIPTRTKKAIQTVMQHPSKVAMTPKKKKVTKKTGHRSVFSAPSISDWRRWNQQARLWKMRWKSTIGWQSQMVCAVSIFGGPGH